MDDQGWVAHCGAAEECEIVTEGMRQTIGVLMCIFDIKAHGCGQAHRAAWSGCMHLQCARRIGWLNVEAPQAEGLAFQTADSLATLNFHTALAC